MEKKKRIGGYVGSSVVAGEYYDSYIPKPLPPEPPLCVDELYPLLGNANAAFGYLDGFCAALPDPYRYQQQGTVERRNCGISVP